MSHEENQSYAVQLRMWAVEKAIDVVPEMAGGTDILELAKLIHNYAESGKTRGK